MQKPIVNISEIEMQSRPKAFQPSGETAEKFEAKTGFISPLIGAKLLGYNITELQPGKRAYPFHNHRVNEEMFFVLEGEGELRFGNKTYPVKEGDVIACPPGGREKAHQIVNCGTTALRYLAVATRLSPEVAEYPDSDKFALYADFPEADKENDKQFRYVSREANSLGYWEGE